MFKELLKVKADILSSIERNSVMIGNRNPMVGAGPEAHYWLYPEDHFWTDSFWAGELWLSYMLTGEDKYKNMARMRYSHCQKVLDTPLWMDHDLGFRFTLTAVADYKLTGNQVARELGLRAADALLHRFNWNGNYLVAWTAGSNGKEHAEKIQGKIIIDCMQNLSLLFWAYSETANHNYRDAAILQAETSMKYLIRDDYSTYHTYDFDTKTNEPIGGNTFQGYADESCWSRGQAWAIHGFAQLAMITGDAKYADISAKLADWIMDHITSDLVPLWDYRLPSHEPQYKDTSAGSITASGMLLLSEYFTRNNQEKQAAKYKDFGVRMLLALREQYDLTAQEDAQGLLSNAATFVRLAHEENKDYLANGMLPYGDYYYYEGVLRAIGFTHRDFFW